jgi:hypothetical protein
MSTEFTKEDWNDLYDWITGRSLLEPPTVEALVKRALWHINRTAMPQ